jgi:ribosome-binding protein aMBF1 (putative translation factor)
MGLTPNDATTARLLPRKLKNPNGLRNSLAVNTMGMHTVYHPLEKGMDLGKSIRVAIETKNITRAVLAEKLGCGRPNVTKMIASGQFRTEMLNRLADALDMKVSEFVALGED